ncbi:hypothetical protein K469DRAFT_662874 [Zopfia rhizophila CBS 207.26]|uniref:Uncharacterized protein n=1 Tax=Zopfia rhizophila CBS 207.26 TaxID=1314779 RepID=A0A6A6EAV1_9PEZI|nr:hypothetical protein K469DRAFT_662874 [Zopfia rhizophila CBS 207.26]
MKFQELETSLPFLNPKNQPTRSNPDIFEDVQRQPSAGVDTTIWYTDSQNLPRDVLIAMHRKELASLMKDLFSTMKAYIGLFFPFRNSHCVTQKFWGALYDMNESLTPSSTSSEEQRKLWAIRPLKCKLPEGYIDWPSRSFEDCPRCHRGSIFRTPEDGIRHLAQHHFPSIPESEMEAKIDMLYNWLRNEDQLRIELQYEHQLRILRHCLSCFTQLCNRARDIRDGVISNSYAKPEHPLPKHLVICFEASTVFMMQTAALINLVKQELRKWHYTTGTLDIRFESKTITDAFGRLQDVGNKAHTTLARAEKRILLMSRADLGSDTVNLAPAGPELLLAIICQNLQNRQLVDSAEMNINELYQSYLSKLQYQVSQFPRKRLLRDINELQEELSLVKTVNQWQQKTYEDYMTALDHRSFSTTTTSRAAMFPLEEECLRGAIDQLESKLAELDALETRTLNLRDQLKESVEILEEDHGKAILVFTMITTIFLPLSFVTSFFGMNTADIRNTGHGQGFFWSIALPVTASIVGISVLVAYQGDKMYDVLFKAAHYINKDPQAMEAMTSGAGPKRKEKGTLSSYARPLDMRMRKKSGVQRSNTDPVMVI